MIVTGYELMAENLGFPEGPVVLPDGRVAFVQEYTGAVSVFSQGRVEPLSMVGGNPNGLALGPDGFVYVAQGAGRAEGARVTPAILRVDPSSGVWDVVTTKASGRPLRAPNDLCFGPDGALYFTDPDAYDPTDDTIRGWICRTDRRGTEIVFDLGNVHPNGLAFAPDGALTWMESLTRRIVRARDRDIQILAELEAPSLPDGCAFTTAGELVVATFFSGGLHAIGWQTGSVQIQSISWSKEVIRATNVAFDGSSAWVTDAGRRFDQPSNPSGRLWRLSTNVLGLPLGGLNDGTVARDDPT